MPSLFVDIETYCEVPIKPSTYRYAESAEITVFAWALDDGPVQVWDVTIGGDMPDDLAFAFLLTDASVWFQNGGKFDWPVIERQMPWIAEWVPETRRRDTMVQAYSHSLPGGLDEMGRVLGIREEQKKLKEGKRLVQLFCKPQSDSFFEKFGTRRATRLTHPDEWQRFLDYAGGDITAMRACHQRMPTWNYKGKQLQLEALSNRVNARGWAADVEMAEACVRAAEIVKRQLAKRTREMTSDAVESATQRDEMLAHILSEYGITLPDMQSATLERRIADPDLPAELRELLQVRLMSTTSSVAKYTTLLKAVNSDGRIRGTMQFRGAARTGRVGHRIVQPGNLPRPRFTPEEIEFAIGLIKADAAHLVYSNVMQIMSHALRGVIVAEKGKKLIVADLANIEGRVAAWLAGEEWKLQAFRGFDAGTGPDLYILAYTRAFNVDPTLVPKKGDERQIGKVMELMLQYGGGVGAFITGAATYGIDLGAMTEAVYPTLPAAEIEEAENFLQWLYEDAEAAYAAALEKASKMDSDFNTFLDGAATVRERRKLKARHGLDEKVFVTCDVLKRLWRKAHPQISSYWKELENAVAYAIFNPGETVPCRKLLVRCDGVWLRIGLPSGRALCYPKPGIDVTVTLDSGVRKKFSGFSYEGLDQYTRKWQRIGSYGGKLLENCVQAAAADQLFEAELIIDEEWKLPGVETPIVLDVHDEVVTEMPDSPRYTLEKLCSMLCSDLGWNKGLPLAAAGFESYRYKKE